MNEMLDSDPESSENKENHRSEIVINVGKPDKITDDLNNLKVLIRAVFPTNQKWDNVSDWQLFAMFLHEIDNKFFDKAWLERFLKEDSGEARRNFRILWLKIEKYITEIKRDISSPLWNDIDDWIDSDSDSAVSVNFASIIIALAFIGPNKQNYMEFTEEVYEKHPDEVKNTIGMIQTTVDMIPETVIHHEISEVEQSLSVFEVGETSKIESLRNERDGLLLKLEEFEDLEKKNTELRTFKRLAEERAHELEGELEQTRNFHRKALDEVQELLASRKELQTIRKALDEAKEETEEFRTKVDRLTKESACLKARETDIKKLQMEVKTLKETIEKLKKAAAEDGERGDTKELHEQIGTLKADIAQCFVTLAASAQEITDLNKENELQRETIETFEKEKAEWTAERMVLMEEQSQDMMAPRSLHDSMIDADIFSFDYYRENMVLPQDRIEELETQNKNYERLINEFEEQKKKNEQEIEECRAKISEIQMELTRAEERIIETEEVHRSFRIPAGADADGKEHFGWIFSGLLLVFIVTFFLLLNVYHDISAPPTA